MKAPSLCLQNLRTILTVSLLTLCLVSAGLAQTTYTITDLTPGGSYSVGFGINASGQVTGQFVTTDNSGNSAIHAFLYSGGSMTDLGTLGGNSSSGIGINASGQVTGNSYTTGNYFYHAFLYSGGSMTDLGTLPGGSYSGGSGINDSGQVTGFFTSGVGTVHAFLYSGGSMTDLGTLSGGSYSQGQGINDSGQVVGLSDTSNGAFHAFLYTPGTGMVDLNTLLPSGSGLTLNYAYAINDAGQITGYGTNPNGAPHAFLLSPANVPFSTFAVKLEISGTPPNSFETVGSFTLGAGSNGINPVNEMVTLTLGTFSITIPKNSFTRTSEGVFNYEGRVDGVPLEFRIAPAATTGYTFKAEGSSATGLPTTNPVTVVLTVGDDTGAKTAKRE